MIRKSELIAALSAIEGDPEVVVMSGMLYEEDDGLDDLAAHKIRAVHTGWRREADGDLISIEIARNYDEKGRHL